MKVVILALIGLATLTSCGSHSGAALSTLRGTSAQSASR